MKDRPARPPAPAMPDWADLDQMHARILEQLDQLNALLAHLDSYGLDSQAQRSAATISRFFQEDARQHHAEEERSVFPRLLSGSDTHVIEQVHRLQQDHGWLEEDWRVLQPQIQAIADGIGGFDLEMLHHALPVFSTLYRDHIALEESMVYPAARRLQSRPATGAQEHKPGDDPKG